MKQFAIVALMASALILVGACMGAEETATEEKNIVDTAIAAGNFSTLVEAIQAAGLVDTLEGPGPFTVFAPTDEAFAKIPEADLNALLENTTELTRILTYHVVSGEIMSDDLEGEMSVKTVEGQNLSIVVDESGVMVDNAKVIQADIPATNGVIHAIDTVLMPDQAIET
jgi:uncharacterized surface protein with fasciclin (FAS1) repeats